MKEYKVIDLEFFCTYFILTCLSSSLVFLTNPDFCTLKGVLTLVSLAVFFSAIVTSVLKFFKFNRSVHQVVKCICFYVLLFITIVEIFLYLNFEILIDETIFNIIDGTNVEESRDFLLTYFSLKTTGAILVVIAIFFFIYYFIPRIIFRWPLKLVNICILLLLMFSIGKIGYSVYSSISFGFGGHLSAYSTFSRVARSYYIYYSISKETDCLIDNLQNFNGAELRKDRCDKMVVIIGESYSKYHSQLYGYAKETSPLLSARAKNGDLIVFTDVITPINDTERSFRAIFSLGEYYNDIYYNYTLFPYEFKQAGFYTVNIDNLDLASKTSRVKDSEKLSRLMFDYRNEKTHQFDENILPWLCVDDDAHSKQLFVIKLRGQHYNYDSQFPSSFTKYYVSDYSDINLPENKKQIIADYDNATIYNDFVVDSIINSFEDDNAVVLYFSDHGEEVYDARDYMGHGGTTPYLKYQVEIPFMIWMSHKYKLMNPDIVKNIEENKDLPYSIDDVSHTICDISGVWCPQYVPSKSVGNDMFKPKLERIILESYIYEELINN